MEKFYIVTNQKFLEEIEEYKKNRLRQNEFIKRFFAEKGIKGIGYHICGNGRFNIPFEESDKRDITLYIESCPENNLLFGKQLKKERTFNDGSKMREFRKNSPIMKEFQDLCIKENLIIKILCWIKFIKYGPLFSWKQHIRFTQARWYVAKTTSRILKIWRSRFLYETSWRVIAFC